MGKKYLKYLVTIESCQPEYVTLENCIRIGKALEIKEKYFSRFTKVKAFMKLVTDTANVRGFVKNRFNRRRRLSSSVAHKALNSLIQGGCADYIKRKMIDVDNLLKEYKSGLLLQIHDELVVEISLDELFLVDKIKSIMEDCHKWFKVNLDVDVEYSDSNWADKKKWEGKL